MKVRVLSMVLSLAALYWGGTLHAQTAPPKDLKSEEIRRNAVEAHQELARQFSDFQKQIQILKNRLERSPNVEDKDRAAQLQKVLDQADNLGIRVKFSRLQELLRKPSFSLDDYKEAALQNEILAKDLGNLVDLMDSRNTKLNDEIKSVKDAIKALEDIIKEQKRLQVLTELGKTGKQDLSNQQKGVTKDTKDLKDQISGKKSDPKDNKNNPGGEAKDMKSTPKEGKGDKKASEAKDAGKKNQGEAKDNPPSGKDDKKSGEAKGDPKGKETKPGNPEAKQGEKKDGKAGDKKDGSPSAKDNKGSKSPQGEAKDAKSGKDGKPGESKDAGKKDGGEPKAKETGEAKGAEKKEQPKATEDKKPAEAKTKDKGEENKAGAKDAKGSPDAKKSDSKDAGKDSKSAEAKSGDPKSGQKSNAKPGEPKEGGDQPQAKGDKQPPPPPSAGQEKDPPIGKKQIEDAIDKMKQAQKKIENQKNDDAGKDQGDAIKKLQEAKKELEKRLKILREEELERLIANLKARCERMLAMQTDVLENNVDGTKATFKAIQGNSDKKPTDANFQASLRLAVKEKEIILEATKAIEVLEGEGSAVAFPVAFEQVREDMKQVHRRLDVTDVGHINQGIQQDIIDSLKEMIAALDKKKDEMDKNKKNPPPKPPKDGDSGPPPDQKLLDQIAELKMIRSMQVRLNGRTERYAKDFPGQEQPSDPADPNVRREVNELRDRQERIFDITNKIQKGDNK